MSKGVLFFAANNTDVDYVKIAVYAAKRVKKYLNVPVSIVTPDWRLLYDNYPDADTIFDKVITTPYDATAQRKRFFDGTIASKSLVWRNLNRVTCFELTPYDETLVLDCDYIVNSNILSNVWGSPHDLMIHRGGYDLAQWRDVSSFDYINQYSVPFYWATAFYFKKNKTMLAFFRLIEQIKDNWEYYKCLHTIDSQMFRNDYAFSIAINMMNGGLDDTFAKPLPGTMYYTLDRDILVEASDNKMKFLIEKEKYRGEYTLIKTEGLDIHVMNKFSLSRIIDGAPNE